MNQYYNNYNNLTLLTDLYELTMMQGYFFYKRDTYAVFDMFFRRQPFKGGYTIFAGLEPLINIILNFKFSDKEIEYLETLKLFKKEFLDYLSKFKFTGNIYSVAEGELVFPNEPLIRVESNIIEAQFLESILLNITNFQSLIATKAARVVEIAGGKAILEFGLRRAQGVDGALSAARAAFIGGVSATSNLLAGKIFDIPVKGTMAHSWIMAFKSELESFKKYAKLYPENSIFLVDTYNTLEKGIPDAIKILKELKKQGIKNFGIRIDSGDLEYLSKQARIKLDKADLKEAKIVVSNELDEFIIEELVNKNAPIDFFGVGTNLVTANTDPALSGVYKLVSIKDNKKFIPKLKISDAPEKITNPGIKNILRVYDKNNYMLGDLIFLESERNTIENKIRKRTLLKFYHPQYSYKSVKIVDYKDADIMLKRIIKNGELCYEFPSLKEIRQNTINNLRKLHPSYKRFLNPHIYKVSITKKLMDMKMSLIERNG